MCLVNETKSALPASSRERNSFRGLQIPKNMESVHCFPAKSFSGACHFSDLALVHLSDAFYSLPKLRFGRHVLGKPFLCMGGWEGQNEVSRNFFFDFRLQLWTAPYRGDSFFGYFLKFARWCKPQVKRFIFGRILRANRHMPSLFGALLRIVLPRPVTPRRH